MVHLAICSVMPKFGVVLDDSTKEQIERPLGYGDSRSERIRDLVKMGLAAEEEMLKHELHPDAVQERKQIIRDAMELYFEEIND